MKVNVTATRCIVENDVELNAGEYNINKFYFTFSPEYLDNYVKKALFIAKDQPPIEMVIANDECNIPYDILKNPGTYMFGVYAYEVGNNDELILRYSPEPTHFYVNKGSYIENAETPTDPDPDEFAQYYQAMQELVANAKPELIDYIEDNLPTIHVGETSTLTPGTPATVTNVGTERNPIFDFRIPQGVPGTTDYNELVNKPDLTVFALITESANKIALEMDPTEFKIKAKISDKNNRLISESNVIDLPLESVVVSGEYDATNKKIILTLENGNVIEIPVEDLIDGLATKTELEEGLATKDANIIESISKNGTPLPVNANKNVNITVPTRTSEVINDSGFITNDTNGLSHYYDKTASDTRFSLVNETGSNFILSIDPTTFVMTATLKDKNGRTLSIQTVDLPLESVVVGGRYDSETREVVLTLENGSVVRFSVADLVSGLQSEITDSNKLASGLVDDTNSTNKFVTIQEKEAWNNKSDFSGSYNDLTNKPDLTIYEEKTNKITTLSEESTDTQYPSGKCVYESQEEQNEEIDRLEMVYNALSSEDATGESITIDGTAEVPFRKIDLKGNTEQFTTTGRNIFNPSYANYNCSVSGNNITITDRGTDFYLAGGYSSSLSTLFTVPAGTYYALCTNSKAYISVYGIYDGETIIRGISKNGVTLNQTLYVKGIRIRSEDGTTNLQNEVVNLYIGTQNLYEPYTNGASPNPDYPQDIHVVSGDNTIEVRGVNLANPSLKLGTINATTGAEESSTTKIRSDYIDIENITVMYYKRTDNTNMKVRWYDKNKTFIDSSQSIGTNLTGYKTPPANAKYVRFTLDMTNLNYFTDSEFIISGIDTPYTPYVSQSYPINLGTTELCKIGDYQDYIYKSNDKWYVEKQIRKVVLDGSENWGVSSGTFYTTSITNYKRSGNKPYSNYYQGVLNVVNASEITNGQIAFNTSSDFNRFYLSNTSISSVNDIKAWLSTHNTEVQYVLATPTTTEITDTTLLSQLNALEKAYSYNTQTNISQVNNDLPFILDATAISDIDLSDYVKNTDYATDSVGGVIKSRSTHGFNVADGQPYTSTYNYTTYQDKANSIFIGKGTLENVITGKDLTTKAYVDNLVGDIESILTTLDVGGGV